jgi:transcriptional regulator with XRE-family HTH domain
MTITDDDRYIGRQVQWVRMSRGISQQILADRIGISRSLIAKYEAGTDPIDSRSRLYALASALEVSIADLTGRAEDRYLSVAAPFHRAVPAIEAALLSAGYADRPGDPRPVGVLSAAADRALELRMAGDFSGLAAIVPDLLTDAFRATEIGPEPDRMMAWSTLARAAFAVALASRGLGYTALAWIATQLTARAADAIGDTLAQAAAEFAASQVLLSQPGSVNAALRRAESAADRLQTALTATPEGAQLYGMLHLQAGLAAATAGDDPWGHVAAAADMTRLAGGADVFFLDYSSGNVAVWDMSIALECGDGAHAVATMGTLDPRTLRTAERRARLHIEAGRAYALQGQYDRALEQWLAGEAIAPQYVQTRPIVTEQAGYALRRARREVATGPLGRFAARVGAVPEPTAV